MYASIKQLNNDGRTKVDVAAHESLRRHVLDIDGNLQALDRRIATAGQPALDKAHELALELDKLKLLLVQQTTLLATQLHAHQVASDAAHQLHSDRLDQMEAAFQLKMHQIASDFDVRSTALLGGWLVGWCV